MASFTATETTNLRRHAGYSLTSTALDAALDRLTTDQAALVRTVYLERLTAFENDIATTSGKLGIDSVGQAAFVRNENELTERIALYRTWRVAFCLSLGVPVGPGVTADNARGFASARLVAS